MIGIHSRGKGGAVLQGNNRGYPYVPVKYGVAFELTNVDVFFLCLRFGLDNLIKFEECRDPTLAWFATIMISDMFV